MVVDASVAGVAIVHVGRVRTRSLIQQNMATALHGDDALVVRHGLEAGFASLGDAGAHADIVAGASVTRLRSGVVHGYATRGENGRDATGQRREVVSRQAAAQVDGGW